jgi:hypothetical protein
MFDGEAIALQRVLGLNTRGTAVGDDERWFAGESGVRPAGRRRGTGDKRRRHKRCNKLATAKVQGEN